MNRHLTKKWRIDTHLSPLTYTVVTANNITAYFNRRPITTRLCWPIRSTDNTQITWHWRWLPFWLSKRQSMSSKTAIPYDTKAPRLKTFTIIILIFRLLYRLLLPFDSWVDPLSRSLLAVVSACSVLWHNCSLTRATLDYSRRSYESQDFSQIKNRYTKTNSASESGNDNQNATEWQQLASTIIIIDDNRDTNCNSDRKSDRGLFGGGVMRVLGTALTTVTETDNESNSKSNRDRESYTQWLQKWPWQRPWQTVTMSMTVRVTA